MVNYHHYEWYEYQILTGNVTTTTGGTGGVTNHSLLSNLQGGIPASDEFYHLNLTHYNYIEALTPCVGSVDNYYPLSFGVGGFNCLTIPRNDDDKVNKSGDEITGLLNITRNTGHITSVSLLDINATRLENYTYKGDMVSNLSATGIQVWKLRGVDSLSNPIYGYISYSFPGGNPGIILLNNTQSKRINIWGQTAGGLRFDSSDNVSTNSNGIIIGTQSQGSSITIQSLAGTNYSLAIFDSTGKLMKVPLSGTGNAYICTNSSGYPYRGSPGC